MIIQYNEGLKLYVNCRGVLKIVLELIVFELLSI